jgi:hypothetical protein
LFRTLTLADVFIPEPSISFLLIAAVAAIGTMARYRIA